MFDPLTIEIKGRVGVEQTLLYSYDDEVVLVNSITSPCGCVAAYIDVRDRKIVVKYTPVPIPQHLLEQGSYITTKTLEIYYTSKDGTGLKQDLSFTAYIT